MSISGISGDASAGTLYGEGISRQRRQDLSNLATALKSNDLSGAQKAFSDLESLVQSGTGTSTTATAPTGASAEQKDLAALGQALTAGNLSQAQTDFAQMKTDFKAAAQQNGATAGVQGHHHHHHHAAAAYQSQADAGTSSASAAIQGFAASAFSSPSSTSTSDSLSSTLLNIAA